MTGVGCRSRESVLLAIVGTVVLVATSTLTSGFVVGLEKLVADIALRAEEGWMIGGTGNPLPTPAYLSQIEGTYLQPASPLFTGQPTFSGYTFHGLSTPEEFCPPVCFPGPPDHPEWANLNFGDSLNVGTNILNATIVPALQHGDEVAVFGYSQSATIASVEMNNLIDNPPAGLSAEELNNLHVMLVGDPNNPIGGILTRFQFPDGTGPFGLNSSPQHLPFLNVPLSTEPTPTAPFSTDIYTAAYDGYANFPQDPTNILADINALAGIATVHGGYPTENLADVIDLGSIGETDFYMIPEPLPILWPLYQIPYVLPVIAEMIAPGLKLVIDWSYGNPGDPDAGITVDGVDPIGAAGPWPVTATGHLADISGVAGFAPLMDPLQMLAGMQYAGVHTIVDPIDEVLREAGLSPLPDSVTNVLLNLSGYDFVNEVDQFLLREWMELAQGLDISELFGPDAVFDGAPLISGEPIIDVVDAAFDIFDLLGA